LPPGVSFNAEFAVQPNNLADYGFSPSSYTFVPAGNFLSHNLTKHAAPPGKVTSLLAASVSVSTKNRNFGIQLEEVAAATHYPIRRLTLNDANAPTSRGPGVSSQELAVYRPNFTASATRQDSTSKSTR